MAAELVRAAFTHRGIINQRRLRQFLGLAEKTKSQVIDVLEEIINLDSIDGVVEIREDKTITSWSVIAAVTNMVAVHIWQTFSFANSRLPKVGNDIGQFFELFEGQHRKLVSAIDLLPVLIRTDTRWAFVLPDHVERIFREVQLFKSRVSKSQLVESKKLDISQVNAWCERVTA